MPRYKETVLTVLMLFFAGGVLLNAQTLPSLFVSSDAAAAGTALSSIGKSAGAYSLESNVASMAFMDKKTSFGASFGLWQPSYASNKVLGLGAAYRVSKRLALGLQAKSLGQQPYDIVTESGLVKGSYSPKDISVGIGVAYAFTDFLSAGVTARMVTSHLAEDASANVLGLDAALFFKREALSAGFALCNLGGKFSYGRDTYSQPSMLKAGGAYRFDYLNGNSVTGSLEADYLFEGAFSAAAGAEYGFADMVFARLGYHYGSSDKGLPSFASAGLGIKLYGISLDLAYLFLSETLRNSLNISIGYSF
ncbi:MAG: PorV/PorQ family protein [Bacteroidia bacterium]|nr:PorV/PorQ family protein [Bacteroidia bacterium]